MIIRTPLIKNERLSRLFHCQVFLKREELQVVRSYKIRGAFNKISSLSPQQLAEGIICSSAGNHAQGVAYCCSQLQIKGTIFMPANTPDQKLSRVRAFGGDYIQIFLEGNNYDECADAALKYSSDNGGVFIHPFDDEKIIEGQGMVASEILEDLTGIDFLFVPVGGGGLAAGSCRVFKRNSPATRLIGVEPAGAASMTAALNAGKPVRLEKVDPFVDGAAVSKVGDLTYRICKDFLDHVHTVPEGEVCASLLRLYNEDGIVCEPAGALSVSALASFAEQIKGKTVVCIISGGNNDSNRMEEIKKLADEWEGLQHHLIIRFPHHPDGLQILFSGLLGTGNHVNRIEYMRRDHGRSTYGLVGIRSQSVQDYQLLVQQLQDHHFEYKEVRKEDFLFKYWV